MKRILLLLLPFLPYLASAQVAKDTVTVLTLAQIPAGVIRDTTNLTFVQDNAFKKATFDSLAKYTRVKLQTYTLDSTHITASGLNLQGTRFTGVLPVTRGGTGNTTGLAATATALATARTIQTNLASTSAASFNGTANITPGVTGTLQVGNGGTGRTTYDSLGIVFASSTTALGTDTRLKFGNGTFELREAMNISDGSGTITARYATTTGLGGAATFGSSTAHNTVIRTNNEVRIFVKHSTANVGIGTGFDGTNVSPTERLHVDGNARITAMNGINDIGASATGVLQAATSDYNLKNSIQDSDFGLNHILRLKPVTFLYNDQDRKIHSEIPEIGFIAQDVNDVIPNAVSPTGDGTLQLDYRAITATLTKAIQEQQQQIEQLKQRITQLENK